jgi:hypothetical protein
MQQPNNSKRFQRRFLTYSKCVLEKERNDIAGVLSFTNAASSYYRLPCHPL